MGRKTGLLLANIYQGSSRAFWRHAASVSSRHPDDALIVLPGGRSRFPGSSEYLRNSIYDLVNSSSLDGAIIWSSSLTGAVDSESIANLVKGFSEHLPVVSMCMDIPGIPSVDFDAYAGMYNAVMHFIHIHGDSRIAFLRGPGNHKSAEERFRAYLDALRDSGIEPDELIISSPHPWADGAAAADELLSARNLVPGKDFTAIIAASDLLLLGAESVFRREGLSIPYDIRVCGFNDNEENQMLDAELTTVRLPIRRIFETAYSLISSMEDNPGSAEPSVVLPTEFIIRRSCGCNDSLGGTEEARKRIRSWEDLLAWLEGMLDDEEAFAAARTMLGYLFDPDPDPSAAGAAVSAYFSTGAEADTFLESILWAEDILGLKERQPGRRDFLLSRIVHGSRQLYAREQQRVISSSMLLDTFKTKLMAQRSYETLPFLMQDAFPQLGITGAFIMLYEDFQYSQLLGGFDGSRLYSESRRFPRRFMIPESLSSFIEKGTFVVEPLFYENQELGYILLRTEWCEGRILEDIRTTISSALRGISLTEVAQKAAEAAEAGERKAGAFLANVSETLRESISSLRQMVNDDGSLCREAISSQLTKAEHMLSLSIAEFGDLDMEQRLVPLYSLVPLLRKEGIAVEEAGEMPSLWMDPALIVKMLSIISSSEEGKKGTVSISLIGSGVLFSVETGISSSASSDPSLQLASKIAVLHSGTLDFENSRFSFVLPYPTISGHPASSQSEGPVVWFSAAAVPSSLSGLSPVAVSDVSELLRMDPRPSAIAWRRGDRSGSSVVKAVSSHRSFRSIPFIAFGIEEEAVSLSVALECDRPDSSAAVIASVPRLHKLVGILSDFGRIEDGLTLDGLLSLEGEIRLVVLASASSSDLAALRHSRRFASVPILIISDSFPESAIEAISDVPNVLIANTSIIDSPDFIARLVAVLGGSELLPPLTGALVKRAISYINRHLQQQISRWQLAESVSISEDYLTRIFRREMGISPWDYLTRCRVGTAASILLSTGAPLSEVAVASGFQDQAYFCRVFRRIMGCSPGQYRQRN